MTPFKAFFLMFVFFGINSGITFDAGGHNGLGFALAGISIVTLVMAICKYASD